MDFPTRARAAFCLGLLALGVPALPADTLLQDGDRVAICGDSITERNVYSVYLEDYLLMCRPAAALQAAQFGWSGERSWDFQKRVKNDVVPFRPTVATVLYGMNDGAYAKIEKATLDHYREALAGSIQDLRAGGARVVVLGSPTLVDPATVKRVPAPVYNPTLDALADAARDVAAQQAIVFADVHTPFRDAMKKAKAKFGDGYAFAGVDGIHPSDAGHLVIAYAFLKALGCSGDIGTITYDWASGQAQATEGHQIVSAANGTISVRSSRYPFCFAPGAAGQGGVRDALDLLPFNDELNRFVLRVAHAPDAGVKVTWGKQSKAFSQAAIEAGVNLAAEFPDNPFSEPFRKVDQHVRDQQLTETRTIKGLLHSFLDWQALFPDETRQEGESFSRLQKAILSKEDQLIQASQQAAVPVDHVILCETNRS